MTKENILRIVKGYTEGENMQEIASEVGCTYQNCMLVLKKLREDGVNIPRRHRGRSVNSGYKDALKELKN